MVNNYNMELVVRGRKVSLDQMQQILQQEIDEGQTMKECFYAIPTLLHSWRMELCEEEC